MKDYKVIHQGQCCDCYFDDGQVRLWICRVGGGKTIEKYNPNTGRWEITSGGCEDIPNGLE